MIAIVTVKVLDMVGHNPKDKQKGVCPIQTGSCTDVLGAHHSFLAAGDNLRDIEEKVRKESFDHITRLEQVGPELLREVWSAGYRHAMNEYMDGKWKDLKSK
jgi:hypothetical protein